MIKKTLLFLVCSVCSFLAHAQLNKDASRILEEGKGLYRSEMASWYGTDIFGEKFKDKKESVGGYFSYKNENNYSCIFFSKGDRPKVIATITFDDSYAVDKAITDATERELTATEATLFTIRQKALKELNSDTLFKYYKNVMFNLVPVITNDVKKVYILSGPTVGGTVILGNDYLITFNKKDEIVEKKRLHQSMIPINYGKPDDLLTTMHSHLPATGDYITATDICTLLLYGKFANWKQHYVMSAKQVSIWDFGKNDLVTLTKEAWDRIVKDQKERNKN